MSVPGLFIPTYGKQEEPTSSTPKTRSLPISSKNASTKPAFNNKRSFMPSLVFNGNIEYIQTFEAAEEAAQALEAARPEVLGFDIEWQVSFVSGQASRPTATLQLCVPEKPAETFTAAAESSNNPVSIPGSNFDDNAYFSGSSGQVTRTKVQQHHHHQRRPSSPVWGTAYIFHLCHMRGRPSTLEGLPSAQPSPTVQSGDTKATYTASSSSCSGQEDAGSTGKENHNSSPEAVTAGAAAYLPDSLIRVLSDPGILLAGVGVGGDVSRLEREYEQLGLGGVNGVVDLSELAKRKVLPERRRRGMWSLADLCAELLYLQLRKPSSLRTGNWEKRPLDVDQLFYAAADAYAGVRLWQVLCEMPDLISQRSDSNGLRDNSNKAAIDTKPTVIASPSSTGSTAGSVSTAVVPAMEGGKMVATCSGAENKAPTSMSSRATSRLPLSKLETHRLWHEDGLSIGEVAEVRCNKASTVRGYLSDCIEAGLPYDWERIGIDPVKEKEIVDALLIATDTYKPGMEEIDHHQHDKEPINVATKQGQTEGQVPAGSRTVSHVCDTARASSGSSLEADALHAAVLAPPVEVNVPLAVITGSRAGSTCDEALGAGVNDVDGQSAGGSGSHHADGSLDRLVHCVVSENHNNSLNTLGRDARGVLLAESEPGYEKASMAGRWEAVKLKEVKALAPQSEYWEIRMVLARLKSGWSRYRT